MPGLVAGPAKFLRLQRPRHRLLSGSLLYLLIVTLAKSKKSVYILSKLLTVKSALIPYIPVVRSELMVVWVRGSVGQGTILGCVKNLALNELPWVFCKRWLFLKAWHYPSEIITILLIACLPLECSCWHSIWMLSASREYCRLHLTWIFPCCRSRPHVFQSLVSSSYADNVKVKIN